MQRAGKSSSPPSLPAVRRGRGAKGKRRRQTASTIKPSQVEDARARAGSSSASASSSLSSSSSSSSSSSASHPEPVMFGRYVILAERAGGVLGTSYVAYDPERERKVVLKILNPPSLRLSNEVAANAQKVMLAAQAAAQIAHENFLVVLDAGLVGDHAFVAVEELEGRSLRAWLKEQRRTTREIVDVFTLVARAVASAHEHAHMLRDITPEHIVITGRGRVILLDAGLLQALEDYDPDARIPRAEQALRRDGVAVGSPSYTPPERYLGKPEDVRGDQFGLCVSLYEALYGARPFVGDSLAELQRAILAGRARAPRRAPKDASRGGRRRIPRWLRRVVRRGLRPLPRSRFADMRALIKALERRRVRRLRRALWWLFLVALLGLAVFAVWLMRQPGEVLVAARWRDQARPLSEVWIDGARHEVGDGAGVRVSPGVHHVAVRVAGYLPAEVAIEVEPRSRKEVSLALQRVEATFELDVEPAGAEVSVDGETYGSRLDKFAIAVGTHEIRVRKAGHVEARLTWSAGPGERVTGFVSLQRALTWGRLLPGAGLELAWLGDVDRDGRDELVYRTRHEWVALDPWTDTPRWELRADASAHGELGRLADVSGDGVLDVLGFVRDEDGALQLVAWSGRARGASPARLWTRGRPDDVPEGGDRVVRGDVVLADLDGDGRQEVVVAGVWGAHVSVLAGGSGKELWTRVYERDIYGVAASPHARLYVAGADKLRALDGASGDELWEVDATLELKDATAPTPDDAGGDAPAEAEATGEQASKPRSGKKKKKKKKNSRRARRSKTKKSTKTTKKKTKKIDEGTGSPQGAPPGDETAPGDAGAPEAGAPSSAPSLEVSALVRRATTSPPWITAVAAGDDDVVITQVTQDGAPAVQVRSGSDGALFWEYPFGILQHLRPGREVVDVDGDGRPEVLARFEAHDDGQAKAAVVGGYKGEALWMTPQVADCQFLVWPRDSDPIVACTAGSVLTLRSATTGAPVGEVTFEDELLPGLALGDLDRDSADELLVRTRARSVHVLQRDLETADTIHLAADVTALVPTGDADGDGYPELLAMSGGPAVLTGHKVCWQRGTEDAIERAPQLSDVDGDGQLELVVLAQVRGARRVVYVEAKSGAIESMSAPLGSVTAAPVIVDGTGGVHDAVVLAGGLRRLSGSDAASVTAARSLAGVPFALALDDVGSASAPGIVVVSRGPSPTVQRIDAASLETGWSHALAAGGAGAPLVADLGTAGRRVLLGLVDGDLVALDGKDGVEVFRGHLGGRAREAAVVGDIDGDGGPEYLLAVDDALVCLDASGQEVWRKGDHVAPHTRPALVDLDGDGALEIVTATVSRGVVALDGKGKVLWRARLKGPGRGALAPTSPVVIADLEGDERPEVVVGHEDGSVLVLDASSGAQRWRHQLTTRQPIRAAPVVGDVDGDEVSEVFVGGLDGQLTCLRHVPRVEDGE